MRIGVLGSGGREHALQWALMKSPDVEIVYAIPGNGGTVNNQSIDVADHGAVARGCSELALDLLVIGPEQPLADGLVDRLATESIRVFGPLQAAARLESSKLWAKEFMRRHAIPTAPYTAVASRQELTEAFRDSEGGVVLKADGLAAGKGVVVCRESSDLSQAWERVIALCPKDRLFAEACLSGWELSLVVITDGRTWRAFPPTQDHKQLLDGDRGPNTGGMGAFTPVERCGADLLREIETSIVEPTLGGLREEKISYTGFLYFGLMITAAGPQVLEYNVRMGDPEAEVILPALESDLLELLDAARDGHLHATAPRFRDEAFVDVVLASPGYPQAYTTGHPIDGLDSVRDSIVFHAGTSIENDRIVTAGGRVLNVVAVGESLQQAINHAYADVERIRFEGMSYRTDIGRRRRG